MTFPCSIRPVTQMATRATAMTEVIPLQDRQPSLVYHTTLCMKVHLISVFASEIPHCVGRHRSLALAIIRLVYLVVQFWRVTDHEQVSDALSEPDC